jgi:outer membrane protein, heavy metal efflux system
MSFIQRSRACVRLHAAVIIAAAVLGGLPAPATAQTKPAALNLQEAVSRALAADPGVAAARSRLEAANAGARQAGLRPNPSIGVELENFAGSGAYSLLDRTEATVTYQQTWERGGKRNARSAVAGAERAVVQAKEAVRRLDLAKTVQLAYGDAAAAEAELLIAEVRLLDAQRAQQDIARRVRSARDPLFAAARAQTLTAQAEINRDRARQAATNAKAALAALINAGPSFTVEVDPFFAVSTPTLAGAEETPDLRLLAAERDVAAARAELERARQVADPTVHAGVRYFGDGSDVAFVVGGTLPLQRHDNNRAGVERALAERNAAEADLAAARLKRAREVARVTARLSALAEESERIRKDVIPAATETVRLVRDGFNRGGFQYLDVTEAERALADARARRVEVLRQFHTDQAEFDRLAGRFAGLATLPAEIR